MTIDIQSKIRLSQTVFSQDIEGEMVLLDMHSEHYFGLDEVGTSIWYAMEETERLDEMLELLLVQYEVDKDILQKDVIAFMETLVKNGLAEVIEA